MAYDNISKFQFLSRKPRLNWTLIFTILKQHYLMIQSTIAWALLQNKFKLEHAIFSFDTDRKSARLFSQENAYKIPRINIFIFSSHDPNENFLFNFVSWTKKFFAHMSIIKFSCCVYRLGPHETEKWFVTARVDFRGRVIPWREKIKVNSDLFSRNSCKTKKRKKITNLLISHES